MHPQKKTALPAATGERRVEVFSMCALIALIKRERKERVFKARSYLLLHLNEFSYGGSSCFALAGLAAPSGILGAATGNGYDWQKRRTTSRHLSPVPSLKGGRRYGARPLHIYMYTECMYAGRPAGPYRYVDVREAPPRNVTAQPLHTYIRCDKPLNLKGQHLRYGLAHSLKEPAPKGAPPLKGVAPIKGLAPTPPLKPKRPRREATEPARACARPLFLKSPKSQRGVFVTPPSRITPA